jgi:hypothetical protein
LTTTSPTAPIRTPAVPAIAIAAANPTVHVAVLSDRIATIRRRRAHRVHPVYENHR